MQLPPIEVLVEVAYAGVASTLVLALTWRWRRQAWPAALALGAGFCVTYWSAIGPPELAPVDGTRYLFHLAVGGALIGLVLGAEKTPAAMRWLLPVAASAAAIWVVLRQFAPHHWEDATQRALWMGGLAAGTAAAWHVLDWRARAVDGWTAPVALFIVAAAAGHAVGQWAGSGQIGQLYGAMAAALAPVVLFRHKVGRPVVAVFMLLTCGLLLSATFFAELPKASAVLLVAAPLFLVRKPRWAGLAVAAAIIGAALFLAYDGQPEEVEGEEDPYAEYFD